MTLQHISAVPVIGFNGMVVGNVSARDVRQLIIAPDNYRMLNGPVRQFLSAVSTVEHEAMCPAITCRPKDALEKVIAQVLSRFRI